MTARAQTTAEPLRPSGIDPLRWLWDLLTNVKFALVLVGAAGTASFIGVVIPQVPAPMRANPAARSAWIELRRDDYGPFTGAVDSLGLFDIFHAPWFTALWFVIVASVTVCTVSRLRPTARNVHRPPKVTPDAYFESAKHRASFTHTGGGDSVEQLLRKRRYKVERTRTEDGATYLFAERFAWSQYGTFISHLALLMLLIGGLLTRLTGYDETFVLSERTAATPIFVDPGPDQIFVRVVDAVEGRDGRGNIIDYHSRLEVRQGEQTVLCKTSVNDPCHAFGYKVHQAAYFNDIAALRITGPDGRLLFDDIVDFDGQTTAVPLIQVTDASGAVLFDQALPQAGTDPGATDARTDDLAISEMVFPGAVGPDSYVVAWRVIDDELRVAIIGSGLPPRELEAGESLDNGRYRFLYKGGARVPALLVANVPGAPPHGGGVTFQLLQHADGSPYLFASGLDENTNTVLDPGRPLTAGNGNIYTFGGRVEASGVSVRRDPGDTFIWVAVGMAMLGLAITFYIPRRRLWVKVTPTRTYLAGVAERTTRFGRELRHMGAALGSKDALLPEDLRRD